MERRPGTAVYPVLRGSPHASILVRASKLRFSLSVSLRLSLSLSWDSTPQRVFLVVGGWWFLMRCGDTLTVHVQVLRKELTVLRLRRYDRNSSIPRKLFFSRGHRDSTICLYIDYRTPTRFFCASFRFARYMFQNGLSLITGRGQ